MNSANISAALSFTPPGGSGAVSLSLASTRINVSGDHYQGGIFTVPTTSGGTAIPLGGVVAPGGLFCFQNLDKNNYVDILTAVAGTAFLRLYPGEIALGRFNPAITAPAALAHTGQLELQYLILDA